MQDKSAENALLHQALKSFVAEPAQSLRQRAAQEAFYNLVNAKLQWQALRAARYNRELAADAMQDAWKKIILSAHTYNPAKANVMTWATTIAKRCVADQLRDHYDHHPADAPHQGAQGDGAEPGHGDEMAICPLPTGEDAVFGSQVRRAAAACMASLPAGVRPNYRLAFELSISTELKLADMARVLQEHTPEPPELNAEQVRRWVNEAARRMRECMKRRFQLDGGING